MSASRRMTAFEPQKNAVAVQEGHERHRDAEELLRQAREPLLWLGVDDRQPVQRPLPRLLVEHNGPGPAIRGTSRRQNDAPAPPDDAPHSRLSCAGEPAPE
jgi:hypothetical protein